MFPYWLYTYLNIDEDFLHNYNIYLFLFGLEKEDMIFVTIEELMY